MSDRDLALPSRKILARFLLGICAVSVLVSVGMLATGDNLPVAGLFAIAAAIAFSALYNGRRTADS